MNPRALGPALAALPLAALLISGSAFAGAVNTYQVTGPVLETTSDSITVQKGKEKWQIAKDASTKVSGDVKVGDKVTVMYRMTAASIESKGGAKPAAKKK
jgi:hypothetical protein